uniref:HDC14373 n=1 Tax=Drosophila melanogaster TaxID=7227 RepID=Q6IJS2_DROME|nr:TPA_inf: HDC14373 [Drosophila melanogaster]
MTPELISTALVSCSSGTPPCSRSLVLRFRFAHDFPRNPGGDCPSKEEEVVVEEEEEEPLRLVGKSLSESSDDSIAVEVAGAARAA